MDKTYDIIIDPALSIGHSEELEKRIFFISADISEFELITNETQIQGIKLSLISSADPQAIEAKIKKVIENEISRQLVLPPKIIWRSGQKHQDYQADLFDLLLDREMVYEMGVGLVCFGDPIIKLMDTLDDIIKKMTICEFDAREYRYPTLIRTKALEKCGYFKSFPHMLMFVSRLHNDIEMYQEFQDNYQKNEEIGSYIFPLFKNVDYCLPPTMCYHTYQQLKNTQYSETKNQVITSKGKSFRYESKYYRTLERLWDFTIREIVFMGSKDFVLECRQRYMKNSFEIIEKLGLEGHSEVASDPFFCNADTAAKIFNQKMQELKYELRLNVSDERTIAAASFNFHDNFFGERFNIKRGETEWMRSGCVGFGIERLVYAFISQHGLDEKKWYEIINQLN